MQNNSPDTTTLANGPAAAAILAGGIGCCAMGIFYVLGNVSPALNRLLSFYKPAGALSGVSTAAILIWLAAWGLLHTRWTTRDVNLRRVGLWSMLLLVAGLLLTFPPVARLF